ncbi:MAG: glycosyltransferase family 4 protein [Desulfobacteraceae bacterium]|nr:glycosyltransferase family 4 protein [Desulfobacteraceae bacterium]
MHYRVLCVTDKSDLPETELFIRLRQAGVDIEVACNPGGRYFDRLRASNVPIHEMIIPSRFSVKSIRNIRRLIDTRGYEILYCFNNKAISNVLPAARGRNCQIMTYRGIVGNLSFLSPASWTTHLNPRVARIVCVCNAIRDNLLAMRFFSKRLDTRRVITIYKGHELSWYQSRPADLAGEFNLPENAFVLGFAGRNRPRKGIPYLIEAARHLPAEAPIHFLLLGRLTDDRALRRLIEKSPYADRIHLAGFRSDAPAIFAACDTLVMPPTRSEGLSRAVIEAMAYATPPIVTNVGGLPELVEDGSSGLIVPPADAGAIADAISRLYHNPQEKQQMGQNARERIGRDFHIDQTVRQTRQLFEQLAPSA